MTLAVGARFGPCEVLSTLGVGGMGEVYRATDTKLKRQVALKVLPALVADDPDRRTRFQREAEVLAQLNHQNIAHIYGVAEEADAVGLVMELVEGPTLADRIARGPVPLPEALAIARQIADALDAAHEQGIVHRDLKPANIKLRQDGTIKVLDFGLAKAVSPTAIVVTSTAATIAAPATTEMGTVLGTPAYMSPEQASGKPVDRRADVWAFGIVLFEMLTGRPVFSGDSTSQIFAAVLRDDPDWTRLPPATPRSVRRLLRRCLERDTQKRLRDIREARIVFDESAGEEDAAPAIPESRRSRIRERLAWTSAALFAVVAIGAIARAVPRPVAPETHVDLATPSTADPLSVALSPDGRNLVFVAVDADAQRLWLRSLDGSVATPLAGTDGASFPFWSPDSRSVGFFADGQLKRLDVGVGGIRTITNAAPRGGSWNADGVIVFAPSASGALFRVRASGEGLQRVTELRDQTTHRFPHFLPDGRRFLFYAQGTPGTSGLHLGSLEGSAPRRLAAADGAGVYVAPGWVLFPRDGALVAQRFDADAGTLTGDPVVVADSVALDVYRGADALSVSSSGLIAYRSGAATRVQLTWFDRGNKVLGTLGTPDGSTVLPRLSPDGRRALVFRTMQQNTDVWMLEDDRSTRLTFDPAIDRAAIWSPDGSRVVFTSNRSGKALLYQKASDLSTAEEPLLPSDFDVSSFGPGDWSPDGAFVSFQRTDPETLDDIWVLPMTGERKPFAFLRTPADERGPAFSPDGHWLAYHSNASGRYEIYVRPFPAGGTERQISLSGGIHARWSPDGSELFYVAPDGMLMAVPLGRQHGAIEPARPKALFQPRMYGGADLNVGRNYDVSRDGRFLINTLLDQGTPVSLIQNWKALR